MLTTNDTHQQFATYFKDEALYPYLYMLSLKMNEGHICIPTATIDAHKIPNYDKKIASIANIQSPLLGNALEYKPFIVHNEQLYMQRYFNYESIIMERLLQFAAADAAQPNRDWDLIKKQVHHWYPNINNEEHIDWQLVAVLVALQHRFSIITGGPGTGKTTTVAKLLSLILEQNPKTKIAIAAPTGKAAMRMAESLSIASQHLPENIRLLLTQLQPLTLHRLLGWQQDSIYFKYNNEHSLPYDVIIIDEASMIDIALMAKLMLAIGSNTQLILLGDKNQLASVEAGSIFGDICNLLPEQIVIDNNTQNLLDFIKDKSTLDVSYNTTNNYNTLLQSITTLRYSRRFNSEKGIGQLSHIVINSQQEALQTLLEQNAHEELVFDHEYQENIFENFALKYKYYLDAKEDMIKAIQLFNTTRILCALREGEFGVKQINHKIEQFLIKNNFLLKEYNDSEDYDMRPIMVTQNNYELGLYNGDIGIIRYDASIQKMKAYFIDTTDPGLLKLKIVNAALIKEKETAFAMTIHKSQGSEFDEVMIILPKEDKRNILTRELLYTAITRAKTKVWLQGTTAMLAHVIQNKVSRISGIKARLLQA
jgi:exodeoxyribonuclease V alpha subunit